MVTLHVTTETDLSCSLLFDQLLHLYNSNPAVITQAAHDGIQLSMTFSDWVTTAKARDCLEHFGHRYSVLNVEWL